MKKIAALVLMVFLSIYMGTVSFAINIDESTARQYGTYYLSMMTGGKVAEETQVSLVYKFMNEDLNIPAAYVFNVEEQGFVIVSGSDLWYPILGYSTEGLLDTNRMAPSFKWYFEGLCRFITYSQNTGECIINNIAQEWDELKYEKVPLVKNSKAEGWLMNNEWGQGSVYEPTYNKYCPYTTQNGYRQTAYVGCVATAMSQIMHYWKYPVEPVDDYIGYNCYLDGHYYAYIDIDLSNVVYDFEHMPNMLDYYSTDDEIDATALLCYHAGVSVEMNYGLEGSGTQSNKVPAALRDVFLYDTIIDFKRRGKNFNGVSETQLIGNDEWVAMMTTEIDARRPMYYSGYSSIGEGRDAGGHAFVCDGKHPTNGKFHFNWGWDGQPNMWCDVRNNDLEVWSYDFKFDQQMVRYIQPRPEEPEEPEEPEDPDEPDVPDTPDTVGIDCVGMILQPAYPNPATSQVTIPYSYKGNQEAVLTIYAIDGRMMESIPLNAKDDRVIIDVSMYAKGIYLYKIGAYARKFVVR